MVRERRLHRQQLVPVEPHRDVDRLPRRAQHRHRQVLHPQHPVGPLGGHHDLHARHQVARHHQAARPRRLPVGGIRQLGAPGDELDVPALLREDPQALRRDGPQQRPPDPVQEEGVQGRPPRHRGERPRVVREPQGLRPGEEPREGVLDLRQERAAPHEEDRVHLAGVQPRPPQRVPHRDEDRGDPVHLRVPGIGAVGVQEGRQHLVESRRRHRRVAQGERAQGHAHPRRQLHLEAPGHVARAQLQRLGRGQQLRDDPLLLLRRTTRRASRARSASAAGAAAPAPRSRRRCCRPRAARSGRSRGWRGAAAARRGPRGPGRPTRRTSPRRSRRRGPSGGADRSKNRPSSVRGRQVSR